VKINAIKRWQLTFLNVIQQEFTLSTSSSPLSANAGARAELRRAAMDASAV
jgi:hypothetical protein